VVVLWELILLSDIFAQTFPKGYAAMSYVSFSFLPEFFFRGGVCLQSVHMHCSVAPLNLSQGCQHACGLPTVHLTAIQKIAACRGRGTHNLQNGPYTGNIRTAGANAAMQSRQPTISGSPFALRTVSKAVVAR